MQTFWFENCETVGISAGASTPDDIIRDVVEKIKEIGHITKEETVYE
jgi:4-hydroxy-3-methylbut-2-enyl diphosphate reductase